MTYNYTEVMSSVVLLVYVSANSSSNMLKRESKIYIPPIIPAPSHNKTELWFKLLQN
jgi:hypothetical protein